MKIRIFPKYLMITERAQNLQILLFHEPPNFDSAASQSSKSVIYVSSLIFLTFSSMKKQNIAVI